MIKIRFLDKNYFKYNKFINLIKKIIISDFIIFIFYYDCYYYNYYLNINYILFYNKKIK